MSKKTHRISLEVRERAVRLVREQQSQRENRWQAIPSIASKTGCAPHMLNEWVTKAEVDRGERTDTTTEMAEKMNALAETINGLFKAEVIHRREPWHSFDGVEYATLEWVDWFTNRRLLELIGNISPAEAEANFFAALERSDLAAELRLISLRQIRRGSKHRQYR